MLRSLVVIFGLVLPFGLAAAAPPQRPDPGEVIDQVAQYTGLTNDAVSLALKDNAAALGRLTDAVLALQIAQRFLDARDADIAADVFSSATNSAAEALLPPPLMTAIKAVRVYKSILEVIRDRIFVPGLDQKIYARYRAQRENPATNVDTIMAYDIAIPGGGHWPVRVAMVEELIKSRGWNVDVMGERLRRRAETEVDRFWRERMEANFQQEKVKPQKQAILAQIWASVQDILDQLKAPAGINAGLFPDPSKDLPSGWWWARSAGAAYKPPAPYAPSHTPMWMQTVELSTVQGYVFKPNKGGGGSWCRPGKCDLPYQRIEIDITDWAMNGGEKVCIQSLQGTLKDFPATHRRLSERAVSYVGQNPEQNGLRFCLKNFSVSVNDTALNGARPDAAITRHFADVIVRRINAQMDGGTGRRTQ